MKQYSLICIFSLFYFISYCQETNNISVRFADSKGYSISLNGANYNKKICLEIFDTINNQDVSLQYKIRNAYLSRVGFEYSFVFEDNGCIPIKVNEILLNNLSSRNVDYVFVNEINVVDSSNNVVFKGFLKINISPFSSNSCFLYDLAIERIINDKSRFKIDYIVYDTLNFVRDFKKAYYEEYLDSNKFMKEVLKNNIDISVFSNCSPPGKFSCNNPSLFKLHDSSNDTMLIRTKPEFSGYKNPITINFSNIGYSDNGLATMNTYLRYENGLIDKYYFFFEKKSDSWKLTSSFYRLIE